MVRGGHRRLAVQRRNVHRLGDTVHAWRGHRTRGNLRRLPATTGRRSALPLARKPTPVTTLPVSALDSPAHVTAAPRAAHPARSRVDSVDVLRGTVMILMALDHTRDFFGVPGVNPTDPANAALFLTRWITHFCAPVFFLLTGTSAFLSRQRWPGRGLSRYLITRGALLVLLELTVVRTLSYQFNADYRVTMLLVIWALGWSMIVLGALVRLPVRAILAIGLLMIAGHNLLDGIRSANPLWSILHGPGFVLQGEYTVFASYPLVPWIGSTPGCRQTSSRSEQLSSRSRSRSPASTAP